MVVVLLLLFLSSFPSLQPYQSFLILSLLSLLSFSSGFFPLPSLYVSCHSHVFSLPFALLLASLFFFSFSTKAANDSALVTTLAVYLLYSLWWLSKKIFAFNSLVCDKLFETLLSLFIPWWCNFLGCHTITFICFAEITLSGRRQDRLVTVQLIYLSFGTIHHLVSHQDVLAADSR